MYFPYFRGKQMELDAINETGDSLLTNGNIVPIIEPVNQSVAALTKKVKKFLENGIYFSIVVNPLSGDFKDNYAHLDAPSIGSSLKEHKNCIPTLLIDKRITLSTVKDFIRMYPNKRLICLHFGRISDVDKYNQCIEGHSNMIMNGYVERLTGASYKDIITNGKSAIFIDGFNRQERNADYPAEEFFSDIHKTYSKMGHVGFGDFLTIGEKYHAPKGRAHAVVIHFTYNDNSDDIQIRHFMSDRIHTADDPGGKFLEALNKLIRFVNRNKQIHSTKALDIFRDLHTRQHSPGLAQVKKLSMMHHLELMSHYV